MLRPIGVSRLQTKPGTSQTAVSPAPFYGWRLDVRGQRVPVRELGGSLWLYTDATDEPASEPELHETLVSCSPLPLDGSDVQLGRADATLGAPIPTGTLVRAVADWNGDGRPDLIGGYTRRRDIAAIEEPHRIE